LIEQTPYTGRLLLTGIGALYHEAEAEPLNDAWLLLNDGDVEALGSGEPPRLDAAQKHLDGGMIMPAPLDSHTHLLFGGDRSEEFASRARGESYEARLAAGGGIHSTVLSTSQTSDENLLANAMKRIEACQQLGVGGIEIKTGYGLSLEAEQRLLGLLQTLRSQSELPIFPTLLVHVPPKCTTAAQTVERACQQLIPQASELGFGFDVFIEKGAFSAEEAEPMLAEAARRGMRIHVHADQLSASGAAGLASKYGANSAEHLEFASEKDLRAMADAGVAANLLPGAWLQTGCAKKPPIEAMRQVGIRMAVSTDLNPGSSYVYDLILAASLAISAFGLTVDEAFRGITSVPSSLLNAPQLGHLQPGSKARPLWMPLPNVAALFQRLGAPRTGYQFVALKSAR
jgi:imidazolonepropionase